MYMGKSIELRLDRIAATGEGVGGCQGGVVFVPGGLPGERVRVRITHIGRRKISAVLLDVLEPCPDRVTPACEAYGRCGGCQLMHASYGAQLELKGMILKDTLRSIAGLRIDEPIKISPADKYLGYRNRGQYPVARHQDRVITGFFAPRSHAVVPVEDCRIHDPGLDRAVGCVRKWAQRKGIEIYDEKMHRGFLRHVVVRCSTGIDGGAGARNPDQNKEGLLVALVGAHDSSRDIQSLLRVLRRQIPQITGLVLNVNPARTNVILGKRSRLVWGRDWIGQRLHGLWFRLSTGTFFQVNTPQAYVLFERVLDFIDSFEGPVVDAYCGVGVLGLLLARRGYEVVGIESVSQSIRDAVRVASDNDLDRIRFYRGTVEKVLPGLVRAGYRPRCVVLDPPRKGCAPEVLKAIGESRAEAVAYVSCHPGTLARDLGVFIDMGFRLEVLEGVDMFPQTAHLEVFAGLVRK